MQSLRWSAFAILVLPFAGMATAQTSGLKTNLRTYTQGESAGQDTHQYQGPAAGPTLSGHLEASYSTNHSSGTAIADGTAAYGDLSVDLYAKGTKDPQGDAYSTVTHDGNPSVEYFDRVLVTGPTPGATVTVHVTGLLTDLYRLEGNNRNELNTPQGVDAYFDINGSVGGSGTLHLSSYRAGAYVYENHSGSLDFTAKVGDTFGIRGYLYGDANVSDTFYGAGVNSATGITQGRFLTSLSVGTAGVGLIGDSGHVYQAVPEPASIAALGLGMAAFLRRRHRR